MQFSWVNFLIECHVGLLKLHPPRFCPRWSQRLRCSSIWSTGPGNFPQILQDMDTDGTGRQISSQWQMTIRYISKEGKVMSNSLECDLHYLHQVVALTNENHHGEEDDLPCTPTNRSNSYGTPRKQGLNCFCAAGKLTHVAFHVSCCICI